MAASHYNYSHYDRTQALWAVTPGHIAGPKMGEFFPNFQIRNHHGQQVSLDDFRGQKIVLETGSCTCPHFVNNIARMNQLSRRFPDVHFLVLYVREEHPGGQLRRHSSLRDKKINAYKLVLDRGESRMILIDDLNGRLHHRLGDMPNMVYIIDENMKIVFRKAWNDPKLVEIALSGLRFHRDPVQLEALPPQTVPLWQHIRVLAKAGVGAFWDALKTLPAQWSERFRRFLVEKDVAEQKPAGFSPHGEVM